jgi:phosphoglycolate phosphatase
MVGAGARALLERGLRAQRLDVPPERLDALYAHFLAHYEANVAVRSHTHAGLDAALDALDGRGYRLAVLTNKLEGLSVRLLDALDLSRRFLTVVGGDTFPFRKPDPRTFLSTVARVDGEPSLAVMIGDSKTDLDTARAAGVPCVLVDFGYTEIPAADLGADALISAWDDLPAAVERVLAAHVGSA